jgi:hypothetical protein
MSSLINYKKYPRYLYYVQYFFLEFKGQIAPAFQLKAKRPKTSQFTAQVLIEKSTHTIQVEEARKTRRPKRHPEKQTKN